jgi:hypothetical protein
VGERAALVPRGGAERSFACRAASTLGWQCDVLARASRADAAGPAATITPRIAASGAESGATRRPQADYVVVTTAVDDSVEEIRGVIEGLTSSVGDARVVVLGPITTGASARIAGLITGERALAGDHDATFIDPVAEQWFAPAGRARYLNREQLTSFGIPVAAGRLATDLGRLPPPAPRH